MGFRLCFVVEPDSGLMAQVLKEQGVPSVASLIPAARRRADRFLAPWTEMLHIDMNLRQVVDARLLDTLGRPYCSEDSGEAWCDFNLGSRQEAMFELIDPHVFAQKCTKVRQKADEIVRSTTDFRKKSIRFCGC